MSTPSTSAPSLASGSAVVPSPHPRSRTLRPFVTPRLFTSASPLSLMLAATRVKSPLFPKSLVRIGLVRSHRLYSFHEPFED